MEKWIVPVGSCLSVQEFLASAVRGKSVLDVGCVEHSASAEAADTWLHKHLRGSAGRVVGLDFAADDVAELNRRGYEIICADAMTCDLPERFEIVVCGEILEHVDNPGALLRNMRRHLAPGGSLIVTVPNVFFALHFVESLVCTPWLRWNPQHVAWYCHFTLQCLMERCGLKPVEAWYFTRSRKARGVLRTLGLRCPQALASTLVMRAVGN